MNRKEMLELGDRNRNEEQKAIRRRQLAEVLSHQGRIELDIDPEGLAELRATS